MIDYRIEDGLTGPGEEPQGCSRVFLESNFDTLSISFAERERIRTCSPSGVTIFQSEDGTPNLSVNGVPIYDRQAPGKGAKRQVDQIEADDDTTLVVIMGLGLGYHAEHLERRFACPILVYEPNMDILAATLGHRPLPLKRTIVSSDIAHLLVQTQSRLQFNDRKMVVAAILEYQHLFKEGFELFRKTMSQALSNAQILENTTIVRSGDWIQHATENVPNAADRQSIECIEERFKGRPGILVSAGPSLDKNIEHLKAAENRAVIIAVNAAARPLEKAGVKPTLVAVVEGLDLREQLKDLSWLGDIALAPTLNCFPGFFDLPAKHIFPVVDFSVAASDWFSKAYHWRQMPSGGSVACTAFSILHALGCDPIILVGQDLAYTNGQSYASGATFGKQTMRYDPERRKLTALESERNPTIESIRIQGGLAVLDDLDATETTAWGQKGTVYSIAIFDLFRSWFETAADTWAKERTLINATEGGAHIEGFEEIPLADAVVRYCTSPFAPDDVLDAAAAAAAPNDLRLLLQVIETDLRTVQQLMDTARNAKAEAQRAAALLEAGDVGEADPVLRNLSGLESRLRALSRENRTIDMYLSGKVTQIRKERWKDRDEDRVRQSLNALARAIELFDVIDAGAGELLDILRPVVQRIAAKMG